MTKLTNIMPYIYQEAQAHLKWDDATWQAVDKNFYNYADPDWSEMEWSEIFDMLNMVKDCLEQNA